MPLIRNRLPDTPLPTESRLSADAWAAPRCVLFDFDGTLIDTWRLYLESFRRSLEPHFKRRLTDGEILAFQPSAERRLLLHITDKARFEGYFTAFLGYYRSLHDTHLDGLYPGVLDMLTQLRAAGHRLGVVTGKSRDAWEMTFAVTGLNAFDVVITDDDVTEPKPNPEGILEALRRIEVAPARAFYIGDSLLDCEAARAARVPFGAALWSKGTHEREAFGDSVRTRGAAEYFVHPSQVTVRLGRRRRVDGASGGTSGE